MKEFLYPKSRQFPFDEACERIVRALEARAWKVPGFLVEFYDYGGQRFRRVASIKSDPAAIALGHHEGVIKFGRPQGQLQGGHWNDTAAVDQIQLAKRSLSVYDDESGPDYYCYVGADWVRDRTTWWTTPNARLNRKPRMSVRYSGRGRRRGERAATLAWDRDEREYGPEGQESQSFSTEAVMAEFRSYLSEVILPLIEAPPAVSERCSV